MIEIKIKTIIHEGKEWDEVEYDLLGVHFGTMWEKGNDKRQIFVIQMAHNTAALAYHFRNNPEPFQDAFRTNDGDKIAALSRQWDKEKGEFDLRFSKEHD